MFKMLIYFHIAQIEVYDIIYKIGEIHVKEKDLLH